jgi:hypothetical protein
MARMSGLTILRALSMKRCAAGLMLRPFKVTIAIGRGRIGKSTRRGFPEVDLLPNRTIDNGNTPRKRPGQSQAYAFVRPEVARQMPTYPANARQAVTASAAWEGANAAMLQERFTQWLAG